MFGIPDLGFDQDEGIVSPSGAISSSYLLSSSVPFGFSIQDAIKELSLEEDGDVNTFLTKSAALLAAASPPSLTAFSRTYVGTNADGNPVLAPLTLQTINST